MIIIDSIILYFFRKMFALGGSVMLLPAILFPFMFCLVLDIIIYTILNSGATREDNNFFKENIIDNLLKNFFNDVDYILQKQMPELMYREGKYDGDYNRYYSDDYMEARIDNKYAIKMAEIKTEDVETETDSEGNTTTTTRTVFSGLFAKINIGKSIENELRIKQNGTLFKKNKLEMDSQEFEKYFDVISTNQIVGMQLLTHDIMDLLTEYRTNLKKHLIY